MMQINCFSFSAITQYISVDDAKKLSLLSIVRKSDVIESPVI